MTPASGEERHATTQANGESFWDWVVRAECTNLFIKDVESKGLMIALENRLLRIELLHVGRVEFENGYAAGYARGKEEAE